MIWETKSISELILTFIFRIWYSDAVSETLYICLLTGLTRITHWTFPKPHLYIEILMILAIALLNFIASKDILTFITNLWKINFLVTLFLSLPVTHLGPTKVFGKVRRRVRFLKSSENINSIFWLENYKSKIWFCI